MLKRILRTPKIVEKSSDSVKTAIVHAVGPLFRAVKSPDEDMKELLAIVQEQRVYPDGKTFVDLIPKTRMRALAKEYSLARQDPTFNLSEFVHSHFYEYKPGDAVEYVPNEHTTAREHVKNLWPVLKRQNRKPRGSLLPLPYSYVVPGGRFSEQYYWDTYFVMLGLAADGEWRLIESMVRNYAYMLRTFGLIPTANRSYYLSRSQPPFFASMVKLLAREKGRARTYAEYLPSLVKEYRFWMKGRNSVSQHADHMAMARVVQMPNGTILNRYFDNKSTPRPEMRRDDVETAELSKSRNKDKIFLDLRAGAESGWDFSSRWFSDPAVIQSIHTTDIVPVDLNCLMYQMETTIAEAFRLLKQPLLARRYHAAAERRKDAMLRYFWNEESQFFEDYDFRKGHTTGQPTLAGVYALYAKVATTEQAAAVAKKLEKDFLKKGGLLTTLVNNGQQWDAPNGWAPLQWIAIMGLREYGYYALANEIRDRWLATNDTVFAEKRKLVEKYDVVAANGGGGGEYPLQDGFGWTNGVYAALYDERERANGK